MDSATGSSLSLADLDDQQDAAALAVMEAALSEQGYKRLQDIRAASMTDLAADGLARYCLHALGEAHPLSHRGRLARWSPARLLDCGRRKHCCTAGSSRRLVIRPRSRERSGLEVEPSRPTPDGASCPACPALRSSRAAGRPAAVSRSFGPCGGKPSRLCSPCPPSTLGVHRLWTTGGAGCRPARNQLGPLPAGDPARSCSTDCPPRAQARYERPWHGWPMAG